MRELKINNSYVNTRFVFSSLTGSKRTEKMPKLEIAWALPFYTITKHRVLVQNYSRPLELQANNSDVPFNALMEKCMPCLPMTSYDLQTFGKPCSTTRREWKLVDRVLS